MRSFSAASRRAVQKATCHLACPPSAAFIEISFGHKSSRASRTAWRADLCAKRAPSFVQRRSFLHFVLFLCFLFFSSFHIASPEWSGAIAAGTSRAGRNFPTVQIATRAKCNKNIKLNLKKYVKLKKNTYQSRISQLPARNLKAHIQ